MRKVLVFQHVSNEILGTLNPLLKARGLRVRYVNFDRKPEESPSLERYNGLIVLGGAMGVYEAEKYTHIKVEMQLIEKALAKGLPVLGICLGAQMLARVLGAEVRKSPQKEIGWTDVTLTEKGRSDPLLSHFQQTEKVFQLHGDTFEIPTSAEHLASSGACAGQAFRYANNAYGLQFHLEVDGAMIQRWLQVPANLEELLHSDGAFSAESMSKDTDKYLGRSLELSGPTFSKFIDLFKMKERPLLLDSGHGQPKKRSKV